MVLTARYAVEAPTIAPATGGLLSVVTPQPFPSPHAAQGVAYVTDDCGHAEAAPGWCLSAIDVTGDKEFRGLGANYGDPFAIYSGVECDVFNMGEYERIARESLERGGGFAIERGVQSLLLNKAPADEDDWGVVDLTPVGGPVKPKEAVARLEQYAGENYTGLPIFHTNRYGAVFLPLEVGSPLTTKQGAPVANGAGYTNTGPGGVVAAEGQFWLYVSGQVNIWQGDVVNTPVVANTVSNGARALAERIIVATVECFVGAILVTTEGA